MLHVAWTNLRSILVASLIYGLYSFILLHNSFAQSSSPPEDWYEVTQIPQPLADRNAVIGKNPDFIYVIEGKNSSGAPVAEVYRAKIGPGVLLSTGWVTLNHDETFAKHYSLAVVTLDDFVYTIGGRNEKDHISQSIYQAQFTGDGDIPTWHRLEDIPTPLYAHDAAILNGYVYIVGGVDQHEKDVDTVYYAPILSDGKLGPKHLTTKLPRTLRLHSVVAYQHWLYVIGGKDNLNKARAEIYKAEVMSDGRLTGWVWLADLPDSPTNPQPKPRYHSEALVRQGKLVILGGRDDTTVFSDTLSAPILPDDGTLGAWEFGPAMLQPRYRFGAALGSLDQIYVTGGLSLNAAGKEIYHDNVYVLAKSPTITCQLYNTPPGSIAPGAMITYTITCQVGVTFPADQVVLSASIPAGLNFVDAQGGVQPNNNVLHWNLNVLAPATTISVSYRAEYPTETEPGRLITNPGATVTWQAISRSYSAQSNPTLNNGELLFLPVALK